MSAESFILSPRNRDAALGISSYRPVIISRFFALILCLLSCSFFFSKFFYPSYNIWESYRLMQVGVTANAIVKGESIDSCGEGGTCYYITYQFNHIPPKGEPRSYSKRLKVSKDDYPRFEKGMKIDIAYNPQNPNISSLYPTPFPYADSLYAFITLIAFLSSFFG